MHTFFIEIAIPSNSFWSVKKIPADSSKEAKAKLLVSPNYDKDAFCEHIKQTS